MGTLSAAPAILLACIPLFCGSVQAQTGSSNVDASHLAPNINYQNQTVYIGVWLIDVYSFDYPTGSYTFDMYIFFYWIDPNIPTADWYLMNGYPTFPSAKLLAESL